MGAIKDVVDLVTQLHDRVENRAFAADLREVQSMVGVIASENAGLTERNIELVRENEELRRTIDSLQERVATLEQESVSPHVEESTSIEQLSEEAEQILALLARSPEQRATLHEVSRVISRDEVTTKHWLDKLFDQSLASPIIQVGAGPEMYYLTRDGRDYVVENRLI